MAPQRARPMIAALYGAALALNLAGAAWAQQADPLAEIHRELAAIRAENAQMRAENAELRRRVDILSDPSPRGRPVDDQAAADAPAPPPDFGPILHPTEAGDPYAYSQAHENYAAFSPGRGFKLADTPHGELGISAYILGRYINQLPSDDLSFTDHLGRERPIDPRDDIQLQRMMMWVSGWVYDPKFRYQTILWSVNSTNQVAIAGALTYHFNEAVELGVGINRLPGSYTMMGSHPYWYAPDRVMADEFFRPGMTSGVWATGEIVPRLHYMAMLGDNLSQLGINAVKLTRNNAWGLGLWWMPTTGEFGPRGGMGDFEQHQRLATRFGAHYVHSREDRFNQADISSPDNTQIRLSDSTLLFETGALAPGVTIDEADFDLWALNAGLKYKGWALHAEFYYRRLSSFDADGVLPLAEVEDNGFYVQGSYDILPQSLQLYAGTSHIYGEFGDASEYLIGVNWYPFDTRNVRVNGMVIDVNNSAVNSVFGYYVGGQDGTTITTSIDLLY